MFLQINSLSLKSMRYSSHPAKYRPSAVVTAQEMRAIDITTIQSYCVPGIVLMEYAGRACAELIKQEYPPVANTNSVVVVCGKGNNGGDGLVIARHLHNWGWNVKVILLCKKESLLGDAHIALQTAQTYGVSIIEYDSDNTSNELRTTIERELIACHVLIDAIFGTGFSGTTKGVFAVVISMMNTARSQYSIPIISIDMPSGVPSDITLAQGDVIKADATYSIGLLKVSHVLYPSKEYMGRITLVDIGFPSEIIHAPSNRVSITTPEYVQSNLPVRLADSYKGTYGCVGVIAGSKTMSGACVFSATSAFRTGAGYTRIGVPKSIHSIVANSISEALCTSLAETAEGTLNSEAEQSIMEIVEKCNVVIIGPGCSTNNETQSLLRSIIAGIRIPMVLDADALNAISADTTILHSLSSSQVVITPHIGEFSRLTGLDKNDIIQNPIYYAKKFAEEFGVTVVLKGASTVIANPDGQIRINTTGNSGMATAGSGDVLSGIIAGLIAQGLPTFTSASLGVYIHGLAGDKASSILGEYSVMATDIIEHISSTLVEVSRK